MPHRPRIAAAVMLFALAPVVAQAIPAFPGAEGFGANAVSPGLTGDVYHVTSLADTNTPGTLRYGVRESGFPSGGRTIVFDVGGTIHLTASLDIKNVSKLYIAGQTAPSPVTITGQTTQITSSNSKATSNVIVRNLAFRKGSGNGEDAITFAGSGAGSNFILDHVSASWAEDENLSVANNNTNVSVQYTINSESLNAADHAYGSLIRPRITSQVSFHHNLYAQNKSRNPRPGTYDGATLIFDFRNNVVYNWSDRAGYSGGSAAGDGLEYVDMNLVGNYFIAGPATIANANRAFIRDKNVVLRAFQSGNKIDSDRALNACGVPNGIDNGWGMWYTIPDASGSLTQLAEALSVASVTTQSADDAYRQVVDHAGSFWWARDAIDARIVDNVKTNTGALITVPSAADLALLNGAGVSTRPAGFDTDNDGMPNAWEVARGLNPAVANHRGDFDADGYSDLDEYVNELAAFPAPKPIVWNAASARYAMSSNWDIGWQPSRFDTVVINSGTATVDAIAQDAGAVVVSATAGSARLAVESGWLRIAGDLRIGHTEGSTGEVILSGGKLLVGGSLGGGSGADNVFAWTGGLLAAGHADATTLRGSSGGAVGELRQVGGVMAPGDRGVAGRTWITGDYRVDAPTASIEIDLGGAAAATTPQAASAAFDQILATGDTTLGGTLKLALVGGYVPAPLTTHEILAAASLTGHFAGVSGHQLSETRWLAVTYTATSVLVTATLPGDANVDGQVEFSDLLALSQHYGNASETWAGGDFTGDGVTDFGDLLVLAQNYGAPLGVSEQATLRAATGNAFAADWALAQTLVPEPTSALAVLSLVLATRRRSRA